MECSSAIFAASASPMPLTLWRLSLRDQLLELVPLQGLDGPRARGIGADLERILALELHEGPDLGEHVRDLVLGHRRHFRRPGRGKFNAGRRRRDAPSAMLRNAPTDLFAWVLPAAMPFTYSRTTHFADTDAAGVVFFANYLSICHEAYEEALSAAGIDLKRFFADNGVVVPICQERGGVPAAHIMRRQAEREREAQGVSENSFEIRYDDHAARPASQVRRAREDRACVHRLGDARPKGASGAACGLGPSGLTPGHPPEASCRSSARSIFPCALRGHGIMAM